jgi:hypothetical protein
MIAMYLARKLTGSSFPEYAYTVDAYSPDELRYPLM